MVVIASSKRHIGKVAEIIEKHLNEHHFTKLARVSRSSAP
jgi:hypothetical protein